MAAATPAPAKAAPGDTPTPALKYALLQEPDYSGIVGGVAPSPYAAAFLAIGAFLILLTALLAMIGVDAGEWLAIGIIFATVACFLAAFVSRSA